MMVNKRNKRYSKPEKESIKARGGVPGWIVYEEFVFTKEKEFLHEGELVEYGIE